MTQTQNPNGNFSERFSIKIFPFSYFFLEKLTSWNLFFFCRNERRAKYFVVRSIAMVKSCQAFGQVKKKKRKENEMK